MERGGLIIDMNFISGDGLGVYGIQSGASLLDFATRLYASNPEVELVSTEALTVNGQEILLITTESIFGVGQFYLF